MKGFSCHQRSKAVLGRKNSGFPKLSVVIVAVASLGVPSLAMAIDASTLINPNTVAIDRSVTPNRLYVADNGNNRILGYRDVTALTNGAPADLVIGQPDFSSSGCNRGGANATADGLCRPITPMVDTAGNLYTEDSGNNRVLEYNTPFASCASFPCVGGPANLVFGQAGSFTSGECNQGGANPTADSLCDPRGIVLDAAGNVYITDSQNNRVLEYNTPLNKTDPTADMVIGQADFLSGACNRGASASADSLCFPVGPVFDPAGHLYVADANNNRVLEYDAPLASCSSFPCVGGPANQVIGQGGSFTSSDCNKGGVSANSLCNLGALAVDVSGNLYVPSNSRVLEYNTPLTTDTTADLVFGQGGSFTSDDCNHGGLSADSLCNEGGGAAVDTDGNLYVGDQTNNRVLKYNTPLTTDTTADVVLGQPDFGPPTTLTASPAALNFRNVDATGVSKPKKVKLTNKGTASAQVTGVTVSAPFMIGGGSNTCSGMTIAPKKSCSFSIEFAPTTVGNVSGGSIDVTYNGTSPAVALQGAGIAVTLKAPKSNSLPPVSAGSVSKPKNIVFSNPSTVTVTLGAAALGGSNPGSFQIAGDQCSGQALAPKGKCGIAVESAPPGNASGTQSATLSIGYTYGGNSGNVSTNLSGKVK